MEFGEDPFASGLAANRAMLEMVADELVLERLIPEPVSPEELFVPSMRTT